MFLSLALQLFCLSYVSTTQATCPASGETFQISTEVNGETFYVASSQGSANYINLIQNPNAASLYQLTSNGTAIAVDTGNALLFSANGIVVSPPPQYVYTSSNDGSFFPVTFTCDNNVLSITDYDLIPGSSRIASGQTGVISCAIGPGDANILFGLSTSDVPFPGYSAVGPCQNVKLNAVVGSSISSSALQSISTVPGTSAGPTSSSVTETLTSYHNTTARSLPPSLPTVLSRAASQSSPIEIGILSTKVVSAYVTTLAQGTTFIENRVTYSGYAGQIITVTDCPCTRTTVVASTGVVATQAPQIVYVYANQCPPAAGAAPAQVTGPVATICPACPPVTITSPSQSGSLVHISSTTAYYTCPTAGIYSVGSRQITAYSPAVATLIQPLTTIYNYKETFVFEIEIDILEEVFVDYSVTTIYITSVSTIQQPSVSPTMGTIPPSSPAIPTITTTLAYMNVSTKDVIPTTSPMTDTLTAMSGSAIDSSGIAATSSPSLETASSSTALSVLSSIPSSIPATPSMATTSISLLETTPLITSTSDVTTSMSSLSVIDTGSSGALSTGSIGITTSVISPSVVISMTTTTTSFESYPTGISMTTSSSLSFGPTLTTIATIAPMTTTMMSSFVPTTVSTSSIPQSCTTYLYVPQVTQYLVVDPAGHLATDNVDTNYTAINIDATGRLINSTGGAFYFIDPTIEDDYFDPYGQTGYGLIYEAGASDPYYLANGSRTPPHEPDANGKETTFSVDAQGFLHFAAAGTSYQFQFCPIYTATASLYGDKGNHISLFTTLQSGCEAFDVRLNVTCN